MKLIILDRDGVINFDSDGYIKSPDEWKPIPGSVEAIVELKRLGYTVVVATNQSGIAQDLYDLNALEKIHDKMNKTIEEAGGKIDKIYFCPHGPQDHCNCRKPMPGMLKQIEKNYAIDLKDVYFIGDKYNDFMAAKVAGCKFILVKTGYGEDMLNNHEELKKVLIANDLLDAVNRYIIGK